MHKMSTFEYAYIVRELAPQVVNKHFSRMRKVAEDTYRMKIGTCEILVQPGVRLHTTRYIETAENPDQLVSKIEKELDNRRLTVLEQIHNDRLVSFGFDNGIALIFEMFGEGNAILVKDGKTVCAMRYEKWSDREIRAGSEYKFPKASTLATASGSASTPGELERTEKYIIVSMMKLPLGKEYAAEALKRAGIPEKTAGTDLSDANFSRLKGILNEMIAEAKPRVFYQSGEVLVDEKSGKEGEKSKSAQSKPFEFALTSLTNYIDLGMEERLFNTLSDAADEYYANSEMPDPELEKLQKRLEKQFERKELLLLEEKSFREKGDLMYAEYDKIDEIIKEARAGKFEDVEKKYKGKKPDLREKSIEVELD